MDHKSQRRTRVRTSYQDNRTLTATTDSPAASITLVKVVPKVGSTYVWEGMSSLSSQL